MMTGEEHNALAKEIITLLGKRTSSTGELMAVSESVLMGMLLLLRDLYKMEPGACGIMLDTAMGEAMTRFGADRPNIKVLRPRK